MTSAHYPGTLPASWRHWEMLYTRVAEEESGLGFPQHPGNRSSLLSNEFSTKSSFNNHKHYRVEQALFTTTPPQKNDSLQKQQSACSVVNTNMWCLHHLPSGARLTDDVLKICGASVRVWWRHRASVMALMRKPVTWAREEDFRRRGKTFSLCLTTFIPMYVRFISRLFSGELKWATALNPRQLHHPFQSSVTDYLWSAIMMLTFHKA